MNDVIDQIGVVDPRRAVLKADAPDTRRGSNRSEDEGRQEK